MSDKKLYQQKMRAQLDEWKADIDKLKAKASGSSADTQLKINKQVRVLEGKIDEGKMKLSQLADKGEDAWDSIKDGVESAWDTLKASVKEATGKFKE